MKTKNKIIIGILILLVIFIMGFLIAIPNIIMPMFVGQRYEPEQYNSSDFGIESEEINLKTEEGLELVAWRTKALKPRGTVTILSGMQGPSVTDFFGYAKMLADNNWDSLLIEMRAIGKSEGDEIGLGMMEWKDVKAGVEYIKNDEEMKELPIVAMGTSMGGATSIVAASQVKDIDGVISMSSFSSFQEIFEFYMSEKVPEFICKMDAPFLSAYLGFHYGFDKLKYTPIKNISKLGERPILLMHSTEDSQIPFSQYENLLSEAKKNNVDVTEFIRQGDEHFICYEKYSKNPEEDVEFYNSIINFLNDNF